MTMIACLLAVAFAQAVAVEHVHTIRKGNVATALVNSAGARPGLAEQGVDTGSVIRGRAKDQVSLVVESGGDVRTAHSARAAKATVAEVAEVTVAEVLKDPTDSVVKVKLADSEAYEYTLIALEPHLEKIIELACGTDDELADEATKLLHDFVTETKTIQVENGGTDLLTQERKIKLLNALPTVVITVLDTWIDEQDVIKKFDDQNEPVVCKDAIKTAIGQFGSEVKKGLDALVAKDGDLE